MVLDITLAPLALETKIFNSGEKVRVTVSFHYKVGVNTTLKLQASPYYTNIWGKNLVDSCKGQTDILLEATSTEVIKTADVDMLLVAKSLGGIENGTYGLVVWLRPQDSTDNPWVLPGPIAAVEQENVLIVSGNSSGGFTDTLSSMMPMLMMVMMMGMMGPMLSGGSE
jgi:hypothetical protein